MKNIFYIVIDAFCYNNLERKIGGEYTTPFLRELAKNNISATHMYAQAPYTEASLVSILSGENTLENGGYLFGNRTVKNTVFEDFRKEGYNIITQYSPYVYSKAYLRDVDEYFYTRLVSVSVIFDYRLSYYKEKYNQSKISDNEIKACLLIIEEEFYTWITQAKALLRCDKSCKLIQNWVDLNNIKEVLDELIKEYERFECNKEKYLYKLFDTFEDNQLLYLNKKYNKKRAVQNTDFLLNKYQNIFENLQDVYNSIIRHDYPDIRYLLSVLKNNVNGFKDFKGLAHNYMRYYGNGFLSSYLKSIDNNTQTETCMKKQFDHIIDLVNEANGEGKPALSYLQVQDFHLPTAIHSSDYSDEIYVDKEFQDAIDFCKKITKGYKGNIVADLGARYCDNKIREFFNNLKANYGTGFQLVITAYHGYPSFFNPPRPVIYNQTYTEAFHIPFIMYDCGRQRQINSIASTMDHFEIIKYSDKWNGNRQYILSEYGGPGCPGIGDKPVWYTYIDKKYRVSAELLLSDDLDHNKLKGIYRIGTDKDEKFNLVKKLSNKDNTEINKVMSIINDRNIELRRKFNGFKFLESLLNRDK